MKKVKVAFICVRNSCRSQIAEALGKHYALDVFESYPPEQKQNPKQDITISMGCNVRCPFVGRPFDDNWELDDPTGKPDEEFVRIIEEIETKILELKKKLD